DHAIDCVQHQCEEEKPRSRQPLVGGALTENPAYRGKQGEAEQSNPVGQHCCLGARSTLNGGENTAPGKYPARRSIALSSPGCRCQRPGQWAARPAAASGRTTAAAAPVDPPAATARRCARDRDWIE